MTFGSVWEHVGIILSIAGILAIPSIVARWGRPDPDRSRTPWGRVIGRFVFDAIPTSGLPRAIIGILLPAVWPGFYAKDPASAHWPIVLLVWGPVVMASVRTLLIMAQIYPSWRLILTGILVAFAWHPAGAAASHATSPAFPPSATGVVWANQTITQYDGPQTSPPDPWLVHVAASSTHLPHVVPINARASLVPATAPHLPASWHPQRLTESLADQTLNRLVASTLSTTSLWALIIAVVMLFVALGSLPTTGLAVGVGGLTSLITMAILRGIETRIAISPYALNIANLLAMGLSLDYAIFQIQAFGRAWRESAPLPRTARVEHAQSLAIHHAQHAMPWSVLALSLTVLAFPLALPGGLGWSFALASAVAALTAWGVSQFLVVPLLAAWPEWWWRGRLPVSLSDVLDRVYRVIGQGSVLIPGLVFLATFVVLLLIDRHPPQMTVFTPSTAAELLPRTNTVREAFAQQPVAPPSSTAMLVIDVPSFISWSGVQTQLANLPDSHGVQWSNPMAGMSSETLHTLVSHPTMIPPALHRLWHPSRGILLIRVATRSGRPLPRSQLASALRTVLPFPLRWAFSGSANTVQRTASTWFQRGFLVLVGAGLLASAWVRWRLTQTLRAAALAILFELVPFLTTLTIYPLIARRWPHIFPLHVAFPVMLLAVSLMLALALDYQVLLTHAMGRHPTPERIAQAVAQTGGSITSAGLVMASSFYVLLASPLPFLRAAGMLIGTNVLFDTFLMRSFLMPSTAAAFGGERPSHPLSWFRQWDRWVAWLSLAWAVIVIPTLIRTDLPHVHIVPRPATIHLVLTGQTTASLWKP